MIKVNKIKKTISQLNIPQIRILKTLSKYPKGLTRSGICEYANVFQPTLTADVGPRYIEDIPLSEKKHGRKSLQGLAYIRGIMEDRGGHDVVIYRITKKGRDILEAIYFVEAAARYFNYLEQS